MRIIAWFVVLLAAAAGCHIAPYAARGVVQEPDVDARSLRAAGCIEVAFGVREPIEPADVALLTARFGNRCLRPAAFDLDSVVLTGHARDGSARTLRFVDPRDEIQPLHLDAGTSGVEKIRLSGGADDLQTICIDVSRVVATGTAIEPACLPVGSSS